MLVMAWLVSNRLFCAWNIWLETPIAPGSWLRISDKQVRSVFAELGLVSSGFAPAVESDIGSQARLWTTAE